MKNLIFSIIIVALLMQILAMKQTNEQPAPIYNKIINKDLIAVIEDFVSKSKGTEADSTSKFLELSIKHKSDGSYVLTLHHMFDDMHNMFLQHPIIICAPVAGKKIFVTSKKSFFIGPNRPEVGAYFKDDCPDIYKEFLKEAARDKYRLKTQVPDMCLLSTGYANIFFDEDGKFIQVIYRDMQLLD